MEYVSDVIRKFEKGIAPWYWNNCKQLSRMISEDIPNDGLVRFEYHDFVLKRMVTTDHGSILSGRKLATAKVLYNVQRNIVIIEFFDFADITAKNIKDFTNVTSIGMITFTPDVVEYLSSHRWCFWL